MMRALATCFERREEAFSRTPPYAAEYASEEMPLMIPCYVAHSEQPCQRYNACREEVSSARLTMPIPVESSSMTGTRLAQRIDVFQRLRAQSHTAP